jgi:undecaprenyl-diphosphatase
VPVSSSAHVTVVPELLGWDHGEIEPELRKAFEVALHAGTAAALVIDSRRALAARRDPRRLGVLAASSAPPALAGFLLKNRIEQRLGTETTIAAGLVAGALAMMLADRAPETRDADDVRVSDGIWLGLAQAGALMPGVSRSGATLSAARLRGFTRAAAARLSIDVGLPVIAGAAGLEAAGLAGQELEPGWRRALAAGAGAAFVSTLISVRLIRPEAGRCLSGWAAYRLALAGLILVRRASRARRSPGARA